MNNSQEGKQKKGSIFSKYSPQFWLVIIFEFFERGSYYGMMSFISVYFSDTLNIPKENIGEIKGVIQPLLYFLPILSGAIADRFGYRKMLLIAFSLLGGGYFLTSQMTTYSWVFISLVVMGVGAGIFKPIISGTIASVTNESNSTQAFGIYYWAINLGAFLFPLFLVPYLKSINPSYVIIAAGICTAAMIIPTLLFFKDPQLKEKVDKREQTSLLQTVANSFEILYSPVILIVNLLKKGVIRYIIILILILVFAFSLSGYLTQQNSTGIFSNICIEGEGKKVFFEVKRNMLKENSYKVEELKNSVATHQVTVYKPEKIKEQPEKFLTSLRALEGFSNINVEEITQLMQNSLDKIRVTLSFLQIEESDFKIIANGLSVDVLLNKKRSLPSTEELLIGLHENPLLIAITAADIEKMYKSLDSRPFFLLFVFTILIATIFIVFFKKPRTSELPNQPSGGMSSKISYFVVPAIIMAVWLMPGISVLGRIISSVIALSVISLFVINTEDQKKFVLHSKFLLMIVIYSIFWILYFQMFDSVLWYVQAYVDATALNNLVNGFLSIFGIKMNWFFDVEHVTVINAGTIILLQLIISNIVKKMKALPTMVTGITIATIGMGILAISTHIWVFIIGIFLFSIGEMTAHPKFISYIGLLAPADNKALYMGYIFLYGVFGSSIGSIVGAKLYVHYVENLNNPSLLWLIFSGIGVLGIVGLLLYNKYLLPKTDTGDALKSE